MPDEHHGDGPGRDEAGEPVEELSRLEVDVPADFVGRLRRRIDRRAVTGQFLVLTWHFPVAIFLEFLEMVFEMLGAGRNRTGGSK